MTHAHGKKSILVKMDVFAEITKLLDAHNITYKSSEHEPVRTSEEAARVRGSRIEQGAKALLLRSEGNFIMCVIPSNKKIDFKKAKKAIRLKRISMATPEEVEKVTHCIPGGVPPFGNLFEIPVYADKSLLEQDTINFNAGLQTRSIEMKTEDYVKVVKPHIEDIAEDKS